MQMKQGHALGSVTHTHTPVFHLVVQQILEARASWFNYTHRESSSITVNIEMSKCHISRDLLPNHRLIGGARGLSSGKIGANTYIHLIKSSFLMVHGAGQKRPWGQARRTRGRAPLARKKRHACFAAQQTECRHSLAEKGVFRRILKPLAVCML